MITILYAELVYFFIFVCSIACKAGLPNCGVAIGHGLARAGLGDSLLMAALDLSTTQLDAFLVLWRQELHAELSSNSRGYLPRKYSSLAESVPDSFPNSSHLLFYAKPTTSWTENTVNPDLSFGHRQPDVARLASICERRFDWNCSGVLTKFNHVLWDGLCIQTLYALASPISCYISSTRIILSAQDCPDSSNGFGTSTICRIRSSKLAKAPAAGLRLYRVEYSTSALNSSIKNSFTDKSVPGTKMLRSVWIPAPLLDRSLPGMVANYKEQHLSLNWSSGLSLKPV